MRRLYDWYRNWSLATRQFLFLFVATSVFFGFLAWNNYHRAADLFKRQMVADSNLLIARTNQFLDSYLDNSKNLLLLLSADKKLIASGSEQDISDSLRSLAATNSQFVKTLYLIRPDGRVFSNSQVNYEIMGNPELPDLYRRSQQNFGALVVSQPYDSPLSGRTVALSRPILEGSRVLGVAVLELDLDKLNQQISELTSNAYETYVISSDQDRIVAFDRDNSILPQRPRSYHDELPDDFVARLIGLPHTTSELDSSAGRLVVIKSGQNRLGWTLNVLIKEHYFYQNVSRLFDNYKTAALIWLVILFAMAFTMSRYFTRPIRLLSAKMDRVRAIEVIPAIQVTRQDEIGRLAMSYNAMMERIRALLQETKQMEARKKELELKVLQSQIAPHFLYNTLACIGSLARQHRVTEVRETIRSLVGVLSFSFDKTSAFLPVRDELEGLSMYMQIQNIRYGDKFKLVQDIDPSVLDGSILKLTLQPILENAIFHGIVPDSGSGGVIRIRASVRRERLRFFVRDDGVGMPQEKRRTVLTEPSSGASRERFSGIGMSNVHDRLRLYYGKPFGLRVGSAPGAGTVVCITVPFRRPAEKRA
ncbi:sensor histidine kinase [Cohnella zeiphila]|uniref:histidine kinase n=1 Tax=Cohnella zeiphila TaxID=2761120 RepID=A0A7X0SMX3_9BACL|nr:sensor histidine kinase [Cohnella zeiphila]MBB6732947.1 sensor histidine kinase [Cohnella zeiphila]